MENVSRDFSPFVSHVFKHAQTSYMYMLAFNMRNIRMRNREEKKSVDACGEGEAANTRIFVYANGIRSRLIVRPQ